MASKMTNVDSARRRWNADPSTSAACSETATNTRPVRAPLAVASPMAKFTHWPGLYAASTATS